MSNIIPPSPPPTSLVTIYHWGMPGQEFEQEPGGKNRSNDSGGTSLPGLFPSLLCLLSYTIWDCLPGGRALPWVRGAPPTAIGNHQKCPIDLPTGQSDWRHFLNQGYLFLDNFSLCLTVLSDYAGSFCISRTFRITVLKISGDVHRCQLTALLFINHKE